jgi:hypothetical protein
MLLGRGLPLLVFAALICVIAIFFHPAVAGSFVSTHGPVTSLRARKLAAAVLALLIACGTLLTELLQLPILYAAQGAFRPLASAAALEGQSLALRCAFLC